VKSENRKIIGFLQENVYFCTQISIKDNE